MVNVFSFCIYGDNFMYTGGLIENLNMIQELYPDFQVWIYAGSNVPKDMIDKYSKYKQAKLIYCKEADASLMSTRFFPIDDESVDICFIRDADSRIHKRDQWCIQQFLQSDKLFHIIRDHYCHQRRIMGGMWGIKKGSLSEKIEDMYNSWIQSRMEKKDKYQADQDFLEDIIYPKIKNNVLITADRHRFGDEQTIIIQEPVGNNGHDFVGSNINYINNTFIHAGKYY
jgi:hypothetical protein